MSAMKNCRIWSVGEPKIEIQFSGRKVVGRECVLNLPWEGQFSVLIDDLRSKLSGGQIKAESEMGKWCRFTFTLPAGKTE